MYRQLFLQHIAQTSPTPPMLEVEKAEGVFMYKPDGSNVIDLISGISVSNLGHCHPKVVEAVVKQAQTYMHLMVYGELIQPPQVLLAQLLAQLLPSPLESVYLVNSGSEAVEGALKLAKRATGKKHIVSTTYAYHGSTHGALSVMGDNTYKEKFEPLLPNISFMKYNCIEDVELITNQTACVILEPIQSESGINCGSIEFLQAIRNKCNETGTLLIFDEVQNGFGRTGRMFGFEHSGVIPDIICFAKGMGGGMPIGAFVSSKEIMDTLSNNPILGHISTFGGHPVSSAAAYACIQELHTNTDIIVNVEKKAELFKTLLLQHPKIKSIRGKGLLLAAELEKKEDVYAILPIALEEGILIDFFLFCDTHIRIAPPLIISESEIREACKRLCKALDKL